MTTLAGALSGRVRDRARIACPLPGVRTLRAMNLVSRLVLPVRRFVWALFALAMVLGLVAQPSLAQEPEAQDEPGLELRTVDILPLQGYIDPPVAGAMIDLIADANARGGELVVIQLDAAGSISADLDELITSIRGSAVPVIVFVGPRSIQAESGGSAAALLLAAHVSAVAQDATVGPAAPLDLGDQRTAATIAEATATLSGLASERLDGTIEGRTILDLLVNEQVSAIELLDARAIDLVVAGLEPLLVELDGRVVTTAQGERTIRIRSEEIQVRLHSLGLARRILHAATTPTLIYILLLVGVAMLLFEWFQPGFGVAGFTGLLLVVLASFGLATLPVTWWALLLVLGGLGLYAIDVAIAGFGFVTITATAMLWFGSDRLYGSDSLDLAFGVIALMVFCAALFFVVIMTIILRAQAGPDDVAIEELVDRPGIVRSMLNPEGHVYVDGALWRARWVGEAKRAKVGTPVRVTATEGSLVLVSEFVGRPGEAAPDARETLTGQSPEPGAAADSPAADTL
ncbi:MAG: membrane-bound serine protease (ClpP class) [Glaciecola sp.]|jgi:membrane-bound serine protease (ClpP class)